MSTKTDAKRFLDGKKNYVCRCDLHKRTRKFKEIIDKLDSGKDKEWMLNWLNYECMIGEDLQLTKIYLTGLEIKTGQFVGLSEAIDLIKDFTPSEKEDEERINNNNLHQKGGG